MSDRSSATKPNLIFFHMVYFHSVRMIKFREFNRLALSPTKYGFTLKNRFNENCAAKSLIPETIATKITRRDMGLHREGFSKRMRESLDILRGGDGEVGHRNRIQILVGYQETVYKMWLEMLLM